MMRKTKEASGVLLATMLALVGFWTGWTEAVLGWALGHLTDLLLKGSVCRV